MWRGTLKEPESVRFLSEARSVQSTPKDFTDPAVNLEHVQRWCEKEGGAAAFEELTRSLGQGE
jgi:hypothetical protein